MPLPDSDTLDNFGGAISNFRTPPDTTVERDAANENKAFCDAAMATRTQPRAIVEFTGHATNPALSTWDAVWKTKTPTAPTIARVSDGIVDITFPASVLDELDVTHSLNFRWALVQPKNDTRGFFSATIQDANVIRVTMRDTADNVANFATKKIQVWIY